MSGSRDKEHALARLYDEHGASVYRFALKLLSAPQEAEDLTQEVFLFFWQSGTFNPERGSAKQFLMKLTYSRAIDRLRRRRIHDKALTRLGGQELFASSENEGLERAVADERSLALRQAMEQLSALQRECLQLFYFRGLPQAEIAQQIGAPLGTVKTRCRDALIQLKKLLPDH